MLYVRGGVVLAPEAVANAWRRGAQGFLAFPVCWPGTAVWKAKQGRLAILRVLAKAAAASKAAVQVLPMGSWPAPGPPPLVFHSLVPTSRIP